MAASKETLSDEAISTASKVKKSNKVNILGLKLEAEAARLKREADQAIAEARADAERRLTVRRPFASACMGEKPCGPRGSCLRRRVA